MRPNSQNGWYHTQFKLLLYPAINSTFVRAHRKHVAITGSHLSTLSINHDKCASSLCFFIIDLTLKMFLTELFVCKGKCVETCTLFEVTGCIIQ